MKKWELEDTNEFDLWGIRSNCMMYKLAFHINKSLKIYLRSIPSLDVLYQKNNEVVYFSAFEYRNESLQQIFHLLNNKGIKSYAEQDDEVYKLIAEYTQIDFWIKTEGFTNRAIETLRSMHGIQFITKVDHRQLKSIKNIIF